MEWLKKLLSNIWFYVVLIVLSLLIPFGINEAYKYGQSTGNGYLTLWGAEEVFSFFGDYLSFFGTIILGAVAVFQTEKANQKTDDANTIATDALKQAERSNQLAQEALIQTERANELALQMQRLEQANFVSIVSVEKVMIEQRSINHPNHYNPKMPDIEVLDMNAKKMPSSECYHIDMIFKNESDYPIVQIFAHAGGRYDNNAVFYNIKDADSAIYIPPQGKQAIRFIVPSEIFQKYKEYELSLRLTFVNVFDFQTPAKIFIKDVSETGVISNYAYRIAKFVDVKPETSIKE